MENKQNPFAVQRPRPWKLEWFQSEKKTWLLRAADIAPTILVGCHTADQIRAKEDLLDGPVANNSTYAFRSSENGKITLETLQETMAESERTITRRPVVQRYEIMGSAYPETKLLGFEATGDKTVESCKPRFPHPPFLKEPRVETTDISTVDEERQIRTVEWVEPGEQPNSVKHCRITESHAIELARRVAATYGHTYSTDEAALRDFMATHWATFSETPQATGTEPHGPYPWPGAVE
jgi:hypothetical protein